MGIAKNLREIRSNLEGLGLTVTEIYQTNKHVKFYVEYQGHKRMFVRSLTPSDARANLNFLGDVKRWMKSPPTEIGKYLPAGS